MIQLLSIVGAILFLASSSIGLIAVLRMRGIISSVLGFFIVAYATIVLLAEILSELHAIQREAFLIGHLLMSIALFPWTFKFIRGRLPKRLPQDFRQGYYIGRGIFSDPILGILFLFVFVAMLWGAYLIVAVPPNTWDSLLYHLSRVGHWLHNETLHHFNTPNSTRTAWPINAEIGLLWLTALWGNDRLTGYVQWIASIVATISIYGIARRLRFPQSASMFAALIWNTFTIVVVQATSTKNDLLTAAFCSVAFYFLLDGLLDTSSKWHKASLVLFGLSIGLAGGTKFATVLILPGVGCLAISIILRDKNQHFPKLAYATVWGVVGFALLDSTAVTQAKQKR